jgi:hypothetical protein
VTVLQTKIFWTSTRAMTATLVSWHVTHAYMSIVTCFLKALTRKPNSAINHACFCLNGKNNVGPDVVVHWEWSTRRDAPPTVRPWPLKNVPSSAGSWSLTAPAHQRPMDIGLPQHLTRTRPRSRKFARGGAGHGARGGLPLLAGFFI